MPIPFLNSITLNKNEIQEFKVYNLTPDPTLTSAGDYGYMWLNTSDSPKTLKWWDGTSIRSIVDSGNTSTLTVGTANDLSGGVAGSLPYQQAAGDTTFLGIGTADQVLTVNSGATAPQWLSQSSLSVGSATNKTGGNLGDILVQSGSGTTSFLNAGTAGQVITSNGASPQYVNQSTLSVGSATTATTATNVAGGANGSILVQSGAGTTGQLAIGASGYILTSNGTTPGWSASIPSTSVSGLAASATTDTTNASNISSGTLGLARLSLASGQFYVGDASNNPAATAKSSIPLSGFGAAGADVAMGGFKITGLADPAAATDAATRGYVDSVAQGLDVKASCLVATTADITLASPGAVTIDGVYSATDFTAGTTRILVKDQSAAAENGIYIWQGPSSAMTRSADANTWDELVGAFTFVERGTANADSGWVCTVNAGGTLGTTAVTWVKFSQAGSYTAGNGIVQSGTSFNFAQSSAYTAGQIPFASSTTAMGFNANLHWDNSNNRLGIGTATPSAPLHVEGANIILKNGTGVPYFQIAGRNTDGRAEFVFLNNGLSVNNAKLVGYTNTLAFEVAGSERLRIASDGVCTWSNVGGVAGTAMTLNGTGLGVGGSIFSNSKLTLVSAAGVDCMLALQKTGGSNTSVIMTDGTNAWLGSSSGSTGKKLIYALAAPDNSVVVDSSGNVGINTATPQAKLHVSGAGIFSSQVLNGAGQIGWVNAKFTDWSDGNAIYISALQAGGGKWISGDGRYWDGGLWRSTTTTSTAISLDSGTIKFFTNSGLTANADFYPTERLRIDSSGNLGLGVTPSAWISSYRAFSIGDSGFISSRTGASINNVEIGVNWFRNTSGSFVYKANGYSTNYQQFDGYHYWYNAASGTAGNTITFTPAMTLDASGKLGIGSTPSTNLSIGSGSGSGGYGGGVYLNRGGSSYNFYEAGDGTNTVIFGLDHTLSYAKIGSINSYPISLITGNSVRLTVKATGQINFVGLASDPAGAAAGDVYYNSASNKLKFYDSAWKTIPSSDQVSVASGTAGAPSISFDSDTNTGIYRSGADTLQITTGGVAAVRVNPNGSFGYTVSVGGAVEQAISRTTGVTLNKACGAITLVSAAGSTSWQTFTVTNNTVDATDVIRVCQKSGTDLYQIHVTNVANGSFKISFATTGGTTTEQPVFNFAVIKAGTGDPI